MLTAGAIGCAHCDTCDDFPTNCVGGNCANPAYGPVPAVAMQGSAFGAGRMVPGPVNQPGPSTGPAGVTTAPAAPAAPAGAAPITSQPTGRDTPPAAPAPPEGAAAPPPGA
jgi:hypothetical protein